MKRALLGAVVIVVGIPVVAVIALWIAGMRNGAGHTGGSIVVDRPAAQIWPYLTDPEKLKQWTSGIQEITRESGGPGAVVGAKSRVVAGAGPDQHPFAMEHTFTLVDPPKRLGYTLSSDQGGMGFVGKFEVRLDEKNGATTVTMLSDTDYRGFMPKLFEPVITASAQSKGAKDLRALKALVEHDVPATAPATTGTEAANRGGEIGPDAGAPTSTAAADAGHGETGTVTAQVDAGLVAAPTPGASAGAPAEAGAPPSASDTSGSPANTGAEAAHGESGAAAAPVRPTDAGLGSAPGPDSAAGPNDNPIEAPGAAPSVDGGA